MRGLLGKKSQSRLEERVSRKLTGRQRCQRLRGCLALLFPPRYLSCAERAVSACFTESRPRLRDRRSRWLRKRLITSSFPPANSMDEVGDCSRQSTMLLFRSKSPDGNDLSFVCDKNRSFECHGSHSIWRFRLVRLHEPP